MANEFIIKNGFHSKGNSQVTGSLEVTEGITGSFSGDGSGITGTVTSASYAITASTASYVQADNIDQPFTNVTASNYVTAVNVSASSGLYGRDLFLGPTARFNHTTGGQFLFLNDINASSVEITGSNILATDIKTTSASGSFSGSFQGDGTNLTNTPSIYTVNGTIGTTRTATITDSFTTSGGQEIRTVNSRIYREVTQASELPTTLVADTTYIIRGEITLTNNITCNVDGVEIIGIDRNIDHIIWSGTGACFILTDCDFGFNNVRFSSTVSGNSILSATNVTAGAYNTGRLKVLTIFNCQFRGTYDVIDVNGFDLVDINNTLFFYVKATNFGLRFRDVSKLEISSCEVIRWFDESTIPSPSGWATVPMIELQNNNSASFGAVNINGCIIHPQQTQDGINIGTSSTTGFGTISSNAFVTLGLTTGLIFNPTGSSGLADYSLTATKKYDIFSNQGLLNSTSGTVMTLVGNSTNTALSSGTPAVINTGGGVVQQAGVRYTVTTGGRATYTGTKQVYVSLHSSLAFEKQGGGTDSYNFYYYKNGSQLPGSQTQIVGGTGASGEGALSLIYGTIMEENDYIEIYVENPSSNDDILVKDFQLVIRE
jgi:hypothetical protein